MQIRLHEVKFSWAAGGKSPKFQSAVYYSPYNSSQLSKMTLLRELFETNDYKLLSSINGNIAWTRLNRPANTLGLDS